MVHFSVLDYTLPDEGTKWHWSIPPYADHWEFPMYYRQNIPYMIASNCNEVQIDLNGETYLLPKPMDCENRLIKGYLPYRPGTVTVTGFRDGKAVCTHKITTPGAPAKLVFAQREDTLSPEIGFEKLYAVQMCDEAGNPVFRSSAEVTFRVEGAAEVIAVDSGDLSTDDPYQSNSVKLYQGQACVLLRFTGETGEICLQAEAAKVETAKMRIVVK